MLVIPELQVPISADTGDLPSLRGELDGVDPVGVLSEDLEARLEVLGRFRGLGTYLLGTDHHVVLGAVGEPFAVRGDGEMGCEASFGVWSHWEGPGV